MKKTLLAMAAVALMSGNAYSMYVVGDPAGQWDPSIGIKMEETEAGWKWSGTVATTQYFAFATDLGQPGDWPTFNSTLRLSPATQNLEAKPGEYELHFNIDASFKGCGAECEYLITKTGETYNLTVTAKEDLPEEPKTHTWGLIGGFNNWNGDVELTQLHTDMWSVNMPELDGEFKFRADHDWALNFGCIGNEPITQDCTIDLEKEGNNLKVSNAKGVTFFLQPEAAKLTTRFNCGPATTLALRGGMNEWNWNPMYCLTETAEAGVYTLVLPTIDAGTSFKIADNDWNNQYTSQNKEMTAGEEYSLTVNDGSSSDMAFSTGYTNLTIILDTNKNTIKAVTPGSAADAITIAGGHAVYFNLQGARVENPENGFFIRIENGKATKVVK